jgi:enoyl-[acyl-carrier-protein] reductase (NADH)
MTDGLSDTDRQRLTRGECLAEGTTAADAAKAIAFLLSDDASAITGSSLVVDAGASL